MVGCCRAGAHLPPALSSPLQLFQTLPEVDGTLPEVLYRLLDPAAHVDLPPVGSVRLTPADNRELDKLVAALGRNKATWRRALMLHEWLLNIGHRPDDRCGRAAGLGWAGGAALGAGSTAGSQRGLAKLGAAPQGSPASLFPASFSLSLWLHSFPPCCAAQALHHAHPRVLAARPGAECAGHLRLDAGRPLAGDCSAAILCPAAPCFAGCSTESGPGPCVGAPGAAGRQGCLQASACVGTACGLDLTSPGASAAQGGAGLRPTVYTYTAAMRAALTGNLMDRALQVGRRAGLLPVCMGEIGEAGSPAGAEQAATKQVSPNITSQHMISMLLWSPNG